MAYEEYANKVPKEARLAAKGLVGQNDLKWAVIVALLEEGALPFSHLEQKLEVHSQSLSDALTSLQTGGLVSKRIDDDTGGKYNGYYYVNKFGEKILEGFYEATRPKYESKHSMRQLEPAPNIDGAFIERPEINKVTEKTTVSKNLLQNNISSSSMNTYEFAE